MSATLHLKLAARREELARLSAAVEELAEREAWPPKLLFRVNLVLEELGLNVMTHGQAGGARELEISLSAEGHAITVALVDDGPRFDPLADAPRPDPEAPLEARHVGGLGVHLVRSMVEAVDYRYEDGKNHLTVVIGAPT